MDLSEPRDERASKKPVSIGTSMYAPATVLHGGSFSNLDSCDIQHVSKGNSEAGRKVFSFLAFQLQ